MQIDEAVAKAQETGFDSQKFIIVVCGKKTNAKFIDAYFGFFEIEGQDGFAMARILRDIPHNIKFVD